MKKNLILIVCSVAAAAVVIMLAATGNPANMALCIACFVRDTAGALNLHQVETLQYIRPEIIGIVIGALLIAVGTKEFKASAGSSPATRFFLGIIVMIGCLIFLGCPLRMALRMSAGDLNAWVALVGFIAGIGTGIIFLKKGFSLGKSYEAKIGEGIIMPTVLAAILILSLVVTVFPASTEGPASVHATIALSLIGGLVFGAAAQQSRMCFVGGIRDTILLRDPRAIIPVGVLFIAMLIYNLATGHFNLGFEDQPIAHSDTLWNILGMYVVGLGCTLLGGCPLRQLILAGQGSGDAAITVAGLFVGAGIAHTFKLASSAAGVTEGGQIATIVCIVALLIIGTINLKKVKA